MESQPQNPEFRINPENFHPCTYSTQCGVLGECTLIKLNTVGTTICMGKTTTTAT